MSTGSSKSMAGKPSLGRQPKLEKTTIRSTQNLWKNKGVHLQKPWFLGAKNQVPLMVKRVPQVWNALWNALQKLRRYKRREHPGRPELQRLQLRKSGASFPHVAVGPKYRVPQKSLSKERRPKSFQFPGKKQPFSTQYSVSPPKKNRLVFVVDGFTSKKTASKTDPRPNGWKVKLSDFGCSKKEDLTKSFTTIGSIPWMAPEAVLRSLTFEFLFKTFFLLR